MLVKIVTFFLIGIAVLAMFGRLRWPGNLRGIGTDSKRRISRPAKPRKCAKCGNFIIGKGPCPCQKG